MKRRILISCVLLVGVLACRAQTYFDVSKEYPCRGCGNYTADLSTLKSYSPLEIQQVFNSILKTGVEFNFPQGGCQQRAQIMSMLLQQVYKIEHCKVWLFAPADLYFKDNRRLIVSDKNNLCKNNQIAWGYHVAPVVLVKQDKRIDTLVFDPSLKCSAPILLR
ncbi:MAG TPA: protein-glutamine glutaminase family protein, partial [Bacteroidia bacterium]|nr:protein-glutamine glutaminase family protein [Bacteroidia bacterium]